VRGALRTRAGWTPAAGPILDSEGDRVGEHAGAAGYTVGQRQGLGVALGEPRYVSRVDPLTNTITLARREDLETTTLELEDGRFLDDDLNAGDGRRVSLRVRHRGSLVPATLHRGAGGWTAELAQPVWAAAPGQAAVFYDGTRCLGGGRIAAA